MLQYKRKQKQTKKRIKDMLDFSAVTKVVANGREWKDLREEEQEVTRLLKAIGVDEDNTKLSFADEGHTLIISPKIAGTKGAWEEENEEEENEEEEDDGAFLEQLATRQVPQYFYTKNGSIFPEEISREDAEIMLLNGYECINPAEFGSRTVGEWYQIRDSYRYRKIAEMLHLTNEQAAELIQAIRHAL